MNAEKLYLHSAFVWDALYCYSRSGCRDVWKWRNRPHPGTVDSAYDQVMAAKRKVGEQGEQSHTDYLDRILQVLKEEAPLL